MTSNSNAQQRNNEKCEIAVNRICSECFEDLTFVPHKAPCPKCTCYKRQLERVISFKNEEQKKSEEEKIHNCLRSIVQEIFLGDKMDVEKDIKRLKSGKKKNKRKKIKMDEICGKEKKDPTKR